VATARVGRINQVHTAPKAARLVQRNDDNQSQSFIVSLQQ